MELKIGSNIIKPAFKRLWHTTLAPEFELNKTQNSYALQPTKDKFEFSKKTSETINGKSVSIKPIKSEDEFKKILSALK